MRFAVTASMFAILVNGCASKTQTTSIAALPPDVKAKPPNENPGEATQNIRWSVAVAGSGNSLYLGYSDSNQSILRAAWRAEKGPETAMTDGAELPWQGPGKQHLESIHPELASDLYLYPVRNGNAVPTKISVVGWSLARLVRKGFFKLRLHLEDTRPMTGPILASRSWVFGVKAYFPEQPGPRCTTAISRTIEANPKLNHYGFDVDSCRYTQIRDGENTWKSVEFKNNGLVVLLWRTDANGKLHPVSVFKVKTDDSGYLLRAVYKVPGHTLGVYPSRLFGVEDEWCIYRLNTPDVSGRTLVDCSSATRTP